MTAVATALQAAVDQGLIARNPARLVDRVKDERTDDERTDRGAWQTDDAVRFLRSVRDDRIRAAWLLSMLGLRRGEVPGVRWADVDLDGSRAKARMLPARTPSISMVNTRIVVANEVLEGTPKGRGRRKVTALPIPPVVADALRAARYWQAVEAIEAGERTPQRASCAAAYTSWSTSWAARTARSPTATVSRRW
jgi:integrase